MENVWQWDEENGHAYPKYPDECVLCLQCEMDCLNNVIDITPVQFLQIDPLEYSAGLVKMEDE
jgi:NAD-dependent dihydropyrimidine dehydrogenase PreA subunit